MQKERNGKLPNKSTNQWISYVLLCRASQSKSPEQLSALKDLSRI